jgi:hypothetical protein
MRKSKLLTAVATLRNLISKATPGGLGQKEFADLCGIKYDALHSIEIGRLKLSDENAGKIATKTGVAVSWLLGSNLENPTDETGQAYTRATFDERQAQFRTANLQNTKALWTMKYITARNLFDTLATVLLDGLRQDKYFVYEHRINQTLLEIRRQAGIESNQLMSVKAPLIKVGEIAAQFEAEFAQLRKQKSRPGNLMAGTAVVSDGGQIRRIALPLAPRSPASTAKPRTKRKPALLSKVRGSVR